MIAVEQLGVRAGAFALANVAFRIPAGQYGVLMGATGCGKTSLLETICGLRPAAGGRIILNDREVTALKPAERGIGYVPQDGALFPAMSVREHLAFALRLRQWPRPAIAQRVAELADWLGLAPLLDRGPAGLSGGEAQRVALGRALAFRPDVLCLDEPLSALDDATREDMYRLLKDAQRQARVTVLHVTHNRAEAQRLADVHLRLEQGRIA